MVGGSAVGLKEEVTIVKTLNLIVQQRTQRRNLLNLLVHCNIIPARAQFKVTSFFARRSLLVRQVNSARVATALRCHLVQPCLESLLHPARDEPWQE